MLEIKDNQITGLATLRINLDLKQLHGALVEVEYILWTEGDLMIGPSMAKGLESHQAVAEAAEALSDAVSTTLAGLLGSASTPGTTEQPKGLLDIREF